MITLKTINHIKYVGLQITTKIQLCDLLFTVIITGVQLTLKHRETHGCVVSTVATDALVLKHQAISIHNAD